MLLVFRASNCLCALPLSVVVETLRPLPLTPLASAPQFVSGPCLLRGELVPAVDAAMLVCAVKESHPRRMIAVKAAGDRRVGLLVGDVLGLRTPDVLDLAKFPPLLRDCSEAAIADLTRLDESLLVVL